MTHVEPTLPRLEELTAHVPWVRRLAAQLVRDPGAAEDLAQEVCLAALQRPPDDRAPLRVWLATVLRNGARHAWRGAERRLDRERRVARDEALPGTAELVERVAVHRALVDAVLALESPYREALLQRYFDDLTPTEIAARTGVPLATVKTRLARGLARLRVALADDGDPRTLTRVLSPLIGGMPSLTPATPTAVAAPLLGLLAMSTLTKLALFAFVLATGLVAVWPERAPAADPSAPASADEVAAAELGAAQLTQPVPGSRERGAADPAPRAAAAATATQPGTPREAAAAAELRAFDVRGLVLGPTGAPQGDVALAFTPSGGGSEVAARADGRGAFLLRGLTQGGQVTAADEALVTVFPGAFRVGPGALEVIVVVAPRVALAGIVHDAAGRPVADARIEVREPEGFRARFERRLDASVNLTLAVTTDRDGRFALAAPALAEGALVVTHPRYVSAKRDLPLADHAALDITLDLPALDARSLVGLVLDAEGRPAADARVAYGVHGTETDADGVFRFDLDDAESPNRFARRMGIAPQRIVAAKEGHQPASVALELDAATGEPLFPASLVLRLGGPLLELRGKVVDPAGNPVTGVDVWIREGSVFAMGRSGPQSLESVLTGGSGRGMTTVPVDAEGRFVLTGLVDAEYTVAAHDPATLLRVERTARPGGAPLTLVLDRADLWRRVAGKVVDRAGAPVVGVEVRPSTDAFSLRYQGQIVSTNHARTEQVAVTDERGEFSLGDVPRELVYLRLDGGDIIPLEFGRGTPGGLAALSDGRIEDLTITVGLRVHLQVHAGDPDEADAVRILDGEGEQVPINVVHAGGRNTTPEVALTDGRSEVLTVQDSATTLVLVKEGEEVRRVPLALARGQVNRVDV